MKTRKHIYTTLIVILCLHGVLKAQDINFSSVYDVPMQAMPRWPAYSQAT